MPVMPPLNLSERLRQGIEEDVLAGRLTPGDRIDERSLALRYKVSRTPVREALLQLSMQGLITMRPRQRTRVATIGLSRLVQMMEVMSSLEAQAARLAARRMSEAQRAALLRTVADAGPIAAQGDSAAFNAMNWTLHLAVLAGSQNAFLMEQARALRLRLHPYRCYLVRMADRIAIAHAEHGVIAAAIAEGRADAAYDAMARHLNLDADRLADLVAIMPGDGSEDEFMAAAG